MKPLNKIKLEWSANFAYAIGLLTTDGNLSPDGRHFDLTSKDKQQLLNFMKCLQIKVKIGLKTSGYTGKKITHIQFGNINLYKFLLKIGLTPAKTKTMGVLKIPDGFFFDFLRGHYDGDGTFYSYWDPRWRSSFMFYLVFASASKPHIDWLRTTIYRLNRIKGHITGKEKDGIYYLKYAKGETLKLLAKMYYNDKVICLSRKLLKIKKALYIESNHDKNARVL